MVVEPVPDLVRSPVNRFQESERCPHNGVALRLALSEQVLGEEDIDSLGLVGLGAGRFLGSLGPVPVRQRPVARPGSPGPPARC